MYTALSISLTYSLGLPILYPLCALYFVISYWFNKIMLMRYYQKTFEFHDYLPKDSTYYLKLGISLHICLSLVQMSNVKIFKSEQSMGHFEYKTEVPEVLE